MKNVRDSGFTLVELAIVITIIGLLIGGVLKGQELLENARMTAVQSQMKGYQAAITSFRDIYKSMPGDTNNATNFLTGCTATNNCINGDNNGTIAGSVTNWYYGYDTDECFQAWKHLALANLITGIDTTVARPAAYVGGRHVPASPLGGQLYIKTASGDGVSVGQSLTGTVVYMSRSQAATWPGSSASMLRPNAAMKLDMKVDDGIAMTGTAQSVSDSWTAGCGTTANGTNGYNPNATLNCEMGFRVD